MQSRLKTVLPNNPFALLAFFLQVLAPPGGRAGKTVVPENATGNYFRSSSCVYKLRQKNMEWIGKKERIANRAGANRHVGNDSVFRSCRRSLDLPILRTLIEAKGDAVIANSTIISQADPTQGDSIMAQQQSARIGLLMPNWVGDACMATPAVRALRSSFPQAHITGIMRPVVDDVVTGAWGQSPAWFDKTLHVSKSASSRWQLARQLRAEKLDAILLLANSFWSAAVARLAGVPEIVGYDRDMRGWLLTDKLPVPRTGRKLRPVSAIDYYLAVVHRVGCDTTNKSMQLGITPPDLQAVDRLWNRVSFSKSLPTIVLNSNAAKSTARVWPTEKVFELSIKLATELDCQVLLHCGPQEREVANRIAAEANHPRIASMGSARELPVGLSKAVLARASVVVSTDSGARHIAVALDRPVVSIFGPTLPAWTTTYNAGEEIVEVDANQLDCRGCYRDVCPRKHHRCMRDISVERVFRAVKHQLRIKSAAA